MVESPSSAGRASAAVLGGAALAALLGLVALGWLGSDGTGDRPGPGIAAAPPAGERPIGTRERDDGPAAESGLPHTRLPLRLVATVVRENRKLSLATLENMEHGGHQVVNEGQALQNHAKARLVSVERGRVLIDNAGVREQVVIDHSARAAPPRTSAPERIGVRRDVARPSPGPADANEPYRDAAPPARDGLPDEGELSPVYEDGELIGVQIEDIREGSVYGRLGLRDGDVITSVNGVPLGEPTAAAEVLAELARAELLTVAVERAGGGEELLSVPRAELNDGDTDLFP